jgi:hypothetical protein
MDAEKSFGLIRLMLARGGHKIFNGSRSHFRKGKTIVAVRPAVGKRPMSAFVIRLFNEKLLVGWLQPDCGDKELRARIRISFAPLVKERPRMFSYIRKETAERLIELVAKEEREEFTILIQGARLV